MLFLLKRTWPLALGGLLVLAALGIVLRESLGIGPDLGFSVRALLLGVAVVSGVLVSDASLHGLFYLLFGESYQRRHLQLVALFRGQRMAAILAGAAMAGIGEELVFRGLGTSLVYLCGAAVVFGLLHHVRRELWPFTIWAIWQGLLFAAALYATQMLFVTMVAHFLHDLAGFMIFRYLNKAV
jgi:membrane protease YdiL (CAAX protease family)